MVTTIRIILRLIALPFFSALALIHSLFLWLLYSYNFIRRGGEAVTYTKNFNSATMTDTLEKIQALLNKDQEDKGSVASKGDSSNAA
jgi:hypothetical protein